MKRKRCKAKIVIAPDPILDMICEPVQDGEDVSGIIRDMMFVLTNSKHGVGIAANQVGHTKRIIIVNWQESYLVMINPAIVNHSEDVRVEIEGCLSYPQRYKEIERFAQIEVNFKDVYGFTRQCIYAEHADFATRIIQHEIDHLNGQCKVGL